MGSMPLTTFQSITFPTKEAWLAARRQVLTSTELSALFGCNPYLNETKLWFLKFTGTPENRRVTPEMEMGLRMEPLIARAVSRQRGWKSEPFPKWHFRRAPELRLGASVDWNIPDLGCDLELKRLNGFVHQKGLWRFEGNRVTRISRHVEIQVNMQMFLGQRYRSKLGVEVEGRYFSGDFEINWTIVEMCLYRAKQFWDSIDRAIPPKGLKRLRSVDLSILPEKVLKAA